MALGFKLFLLSFFPHRWLDLKGQGNQRLFGGLGTVLDKYDALVNQVKQEMRVSTAVETIPIRETEYGIPINPAVSLDVRRANIIAIMREPGGPMTKSDLINALRSYGIEVTIENIFNLSEMWIRTNPSYTDVFGFDQITAFVERVTRAHVGKVWVMPFLATNPKEIELTITYRATINFWNERILYLDGSWLLSGSLYANEPILTCMGFYMPTQQSVAALLDSTYNLSSKEIQKEHDLNLGYTASNQNTENISSRVIIEHDLWFLDGTYGLDGIKLLDAEVLLYEL